MPKQDKKITEPFRTSKLASFQFGDPDAKNDDLLLACHQSIRGVKEFLGGSKNIVLGERGSGKSALFRLVSEGKYKFAADATEKTRKHLIVSIDEDLDYVAIANVIESRFIDKAKRPHGKYVFLWEIYVLSRVIDRLAEEFGNDQEIKTLQDDFNEILGCAKDKKIGIFDFLSSCRISAGIKVDQVGALTPALSLETAKGVPVAPAEVTDHQITLFRDRVRKAIRIRRAIVYVLVDKIDDFLVNLAYQEQKKSVQALLECTQSLRFPELKLKIFLRIDLFKRLDFEKGGYDKISPQVVRLEWTANDIYAFVARRLLYNYERQQVAMPAWGVSTEMLDLDPSFGEKTRELLTKKPNDLTGLVKAVGELTVYFFG